MHELLGLRLAGEVVVGAVLGSFVTTVAMRSAQGRGWIGGPSRCDACGAPLDFWRTLPILSYIRQRGICGGCGATIPRLHPAGEAAGAVVLVTALRTFDFVSVCLACLGLALLFAAAFDVTALRIPDLANLAILAFAAVLGWRKAQLVIGIWTGTATLILLLAVGYLFRKVRGHDGLGGGDIKLLSALAVWLGPVQMPMAVLVSSGLALIWSLGISPPRDRAERVPFGPFIALGGWAVGIGGALL